VASAPHRDLQVVFAAETHGSGDVGCPAASSDQSRVAVDGTVPDGSGGVVFGVVSRDLLTLELVDFHGRRLRSGGLVGRRRRPADGCHRITVDIRP
jgi:hypothetical protein